MHKVSNLIDVDTGINKQRELFVVRILSTDYWQLRVVFLEIVGRQVWQLHMSFYVEN